MNNELIENIKQWILSDEKIKAYQKEVRLIKKNKKVLELRLMEIMKDGNIEEIDTNNYKIIYSKKLVKKSITKKYLKNILVENFIQNNREEVIKENIKKEIKK